jgi:hypothetical protein
MDEVQKKQQNLEKLGSKGYSAAELDILQFGNVSKARNVAAFGDSKNKDLYLGFVWAKFPLEKSWKRYYARVQNSCIYFCKSVESNDFQVCYMIYNSSIELMQMRVGEWDARFHETLVIKHDFDTDWLLLVLEELERQTHKIAFDLKIQALEYTKDNFNNVAPPNQTNRYSFGKLLVKVRGLYNVANVGKMFFRLKMGPF